MLRTYEEPRYPDGTYDTAMPQDWFNKACDILGRNPAGHIVWYYRELSSFGIPYPVTEEGKYMLGLLSLSL